MSIFSKFILIGGISLSLFAHGQTPGKPAESNSPSSAVAATQPVITVRGLCAQRGDDKAKSNSAGDCVRALNREQFDVLVNALNPDGFPLPPNGRQNLAKSYAEYLAIAAAARNSGLEETAQFRELMEYQRLKTVTDLYRRKLQDKYRNPAPEEITAYYKEHLSDYETLKLIRVLVPREGLAGEDKAEFDKKAHEVAKAARQRIVNGEDPMKVQVDSQAALGLTSLSGTDIGERHRSDFPKEEAAELFSLKPGDVCEIEAEPKNYVIYKLVAKNVKTEEQVRNDITKEIYQKNFRDAMKAVIDAAPAEFNEQYFGPATPAAAPSTPPPPHFAH